MSVSASERLSNAAPAPKRLHIEFEPGVLTPEEEEQLRAAIEQGKIRILESPQIPAASRRPRRPQPNWRIYFRTPTSMYCPTTNRTARVNWTTRVIISISDVGRVYTVAEFEQQLYETTNEYQRRPGELERAIRRANRALANVGYPERIEITNGCVITRDI